MTVTLMKQYHTSEYSAVQAKPFTRVPGIPKRNYRDCMHEDVCDATIAIGMGYEWAGEF